MADWSDWSAGLGSTWDADDSSAALREGWDIWFTGGIEGHAPYELQYLQEPGCVEGLGYEDPKFDSDAAVFVHVRTKAWGGSKLHYRALRFLEEHAPEEFNKIINWKD